MSISAPRLSTTRGMCWPALVILCVALTACGGSGRSPRLPGLPGPAGPASFTPSTPRARVRRRPNIVFVLTDDLSLNLLRFMPDVQAMQRTGLTFRDYFVSDSLCCPSRSSIFTGNFPHDTGVFSNTGPDGGFRIFHRRHEEQHTFAVALRRAGYQTGMMGKYLNGYMGTPQHASDGLPGRGVAPNYVPPGWSEWDVAGFGYPEFNYTLNQDGRLHRYGSAPSDYLTDVIARLGIRFINRSAASHQPFFLELATFAPHGPYVPAPRDADDFPGLTAPRPPSFDRLPTAAPMWLANHAPLGPQDIAQINQVFRRRAQSVQAVDRMIGEIEQTLHRDRIAGDTYIVFSSDNGLHTGEYRLLPGKLTAFDTDIHVPLVVTGPGVPRGKSTREPTENIDLAKTFTGIAGTTLPGDGHSLLPLLHGPHPPGWRTAVLVEHHGPDLFGADPDFQFFGAGNPRTYEAMRTLTFLYVEYDDGEREYYDLRRDPFELHNIAWLLPPERLALLHGELMRMEHCHGGAQCWRAMHV